MEDIGLPRGCARGLGHGENAVYQAGSKSHGPSRTARVNGEEIPISLVYDQVEVAAKYSQQHCKLDCLLGGVEEEVFESK